MNRCLYVEFNHVYGHMDKAIAMCPANGVGRVQQSVLLWILCGVSFVLSYLNLLIHYKYCNQIIF